ncbi:MAG TPA: trypsin-like peptidase domain-containing protein [Mycobacteriales bacterium]|nr:trypsin-like peptidase domain-containing protein [Mycobacteriales bacterium]
MADTDFLPTTAVLDAHAPPPPPPPETVADPALPRRRRTGAALVATAVLAGTIGGVVGARVAPSPADRSTVTTHVAAAPVGARSGLAAVAASVAPAVVDISVDGPGGSGVGSGIVIAADGSILTNNHVVAGARRIRVRFSDGTASDATLVGADPTTDLAVVRATARGELVVATFGDSDRVAVGDQVVAVGSPLGLSGSVTAGIVSALHRPVRAGDAATRGSAVLDAIQTDAAVNPGNSGGPLVDATGRVIGVTTAIATTGGAGGSIGLGFAIPANEARRVADELVRTGRASHARLGVTLSESTDELGAVLRDVTAGGAAAAAGLAAGDRVISVDGVLVVGSDGLIALIGAHAPGDEVSITYDRGGARRTVTARLGAA